MRNEVGMDTGYYDGCTFAGSQAISTWTSAPVNSAPPARGAAAAAPWFLLLALASTGASLLAAL